MLICCGSTSEFMFFSPLPSGAAVDGSALCAESGWDFTSRWYTDGDGHNNGTLGGTSASQILPIDLNALLCLNEKTLASFHRILGEYTS